MASRPERVSVTIVTFNSESFIGRCLEAVFAQDWLLLDVIVVDNASQDGTRSVLARYQERIEMILNDDNRGFAAAQNQAIGRATGEWILTLNPDVKLAPSFLSCLLRRSDLDANIGSLCGKLLRASPDLEPLPQPRVDSAGMFFTPSFRHLDRGSNQPDGPEYNQPALVFGATAAAVLYRRSMIEDVSVNGEFFDEDFFAYREDADLAWRAQLLGWRCLYLPEAVGYHVRSVVPENRGELPALLNRLSVQNRFLMRIKNVTPSLYLRHLLLVTARDIGIVLYCLAAEQSSLGAFASVFHKWRRTLAKRRNIQARRRASDSYMDSWFRFRPVVVPVAVPPQTASLTV